MEKYGNEGWAYWIWQLKNGVWVSISASAKAINLTWQSETFLRIIYFRTSFPVSSWKHLAARFLDHWEATYVQEMLLKCWVGRSPNVRTVKFHCGHPKLQIRPTILISLECVGSHQCNATSPICISCMVLKIQSFFLLSWGSSSQKHGATTFWNAWINNCISRTMQLIQTGLVPLRWWEPAHSNDCRSNL